MKAYKWVEEKYAEGFSRGEAHIGTLEGYRQMEGERADAEEGTVTGIIDNYTYQANDDSITSKNLEISGIQLRDSDNVFFQDCMFQTRSLDMYVFCAARTCRGTIKDSIGYALFEISGFNCFVNSIFCLIPDFKGNLIKRKVQYATRTLNMADLRATVPDPFRKPLRYKYENEVRAVSEPSVSRIQPVNVSCSANAHLIRRIH